MIPILTNNERLARDEDYSEDGEELPMTNIEVRHLKAEVAELRTALDQRIISYVPIQYDIDMLKGLKREFVDRMIGSGLQYNLCGAVSALMETILKDLQDNMAPK